MDYKQRRATTKSRSELSNISFFISAQDRSINRSDTELEVASLHIFSFLS
jgi:hypothetical protein